MLVNTTVSLWHVQSLLLCFYDHHLSPIENISPNSMVLSAGWHCSLLGIAVEYLPAFTPDIAAWLVDVSLSWRQCEHHADMNWMALFPTLTIQWTGLAGLYFSRCHKEPKENDSFVINLNLLSMRSQGLASHLYFSLHSHPSPVLWDPGNIIHFLGKTIMWILLSDCVWKIADSLSAPTLHCHV